MCDYKNGKIYQIVCNITGETYIGSTAVSLEERLRIHKKSTNPCRSKQIIERGDYYIELLETYPCNNEFELHRKEGEYQKSMECINKHIAGRTKKEYYEDNKEKSKIIKKEYYQNNKEHLKKKAILYRKNNLENVKVKEREKYYRNIEYYNNNSKEYRIKNAEKIKAYRSQVVVCECGFHSSNSHLARHKRSKKHIDLMNKLTLPSNDLSVEEMAV